MNRKYSRYRSTSLFWLGEIPETWPLVRFKNLASIRNGKDQKEVLIEEGGFPIFGTGGEFGRASQYLHDKPSVLLGRKGTINKPQYTEEPFWTVDTLFYTEIRNDVDPKYLFYLSQIMPFDLLQESSAVPSMTQEKLRNVILCKPTLKEQNQIVHYLNHQCTIIDDLISKKERLIERLQELRQATINEAVTKGLDPKAKMKESGIEWIGLMPEHWTISKLKWHLTFRNNKRIPIEAAARYDRKGDYPYYGASGIIDFVDGFLFDGEFILVGEDGANILSRSTPLAFIARDKFWVNNHAHIIEVSQGEIEYFCEQIELNDFSVLASGSAQPKLTKEALGNLWLLVPPNEEQQEIVKYLGANNMRIDSLIGNETSQIEKLKEYRQSLISEAVTGKIDVRDWQSSN